MPKRFVAGLDLVHDQAAALENKDDFGDLAYLEGLEQLARAYDETAQFGELGRVSAWASLVNCLRGRLCAVDGLKDSSDCRQHVIKAPLLIVGLPRTGTTVLHRLLASRPGHQGLEYWLGTYPQPRPPREHWDENRYFQETRRNLKALDAALPALKAIHEMTATGVDECRLLLMQSFANVTFQANATVPAYEEWLYQADMAPVYRLYADSLRLIGSAAGSRRWVLKDPSHLWAMEQLFEQFPDALVIQTHRDPVKLIPSVCSLVYTARRLQEPEVTASRVGQTELRQWRRVLDQAHAVRQRYPDRFIDVFFDEFVNDPADTAVRILEQAGETPHSHSREQMADWLRAHPPHKYGGHDYAAEEFGLTASGIRAEFESYCTHYKV